VGCGGTPAASPSPSSHVARPARAEVADGTIRFLEDRVRRDPDDFIARNKLAGCYLQRLRETGAVNYLDLALRAAEASLAAMPAELNPAGLSALAQAELSAHEFAAARDNALQLAKIEPREAYPLQILGDALLELGDYDAAAAAFVRMRELGGSGYTAEARFARLKALRGDLEGARRHLESALELALAAATPSPEAIAWCQWQLGETAFAAGNYDEAERRYREALATYEGYYRAVASLGRVLAAKSDLDGAIRQYELATRALPDPTYVAALGDLYALAGRDQEAKAQYALVEQIARLSQMNGTLYNRQLALFYADHDLKPAEAYENAAGEYAARRDIYGADAVAWAALKAGKLSEAQAAMREALRLGTRDARLFYHAGMIAAGAGDHEQARTYLTQALSLNPHFDPIHSPKAREALAAY
jgi:tetratricopeptide (TPR) repeat protein